MMGAAALGDGVKVGHDSGLAFSPYPELSSCRSSMIRTEGPPDTASSDSTLSTMAWPLNSGAAGRDSAPPVAARTAPAARARTAARRAGPAIRTEGDPVVLARPAGPRVQQRRLPAAGGRRDDRYRFPTTRSSVATRS